MSRKDKRKIKQALIICESLNFLLLIQSFLLKFEGIVLDPDVLMYLQISSYIIHFCKFHTAHIIFVSSHFRLGPGQKYNSPSPMV